MNSPEVTRVLACQCFMIAAAVCGPKDPGMVLAFGTFLIFAALHLATEQIASQEKP